MSTTSPDPFDAAAVAQALAGTWTFPASSEPDGMGYLHFTGDGRVFQFISDPQQPEKRIPMGLRISIESPTTLRLRSKGKPDGWTCSYHFDGATLTLLPPTVTFSCRRLTAEEIPAWLRDALAASLSKP